MGSTLKVRLAAGGAIALAAAGSGVVAHALTASTGRHQLAYADTVSESDPPQVALGVALGAFRGIFVNFLWIRANALKEAGQFHESVELAKLITRLQPRFPRVWAFQAWNNAYNISVSTQTPEERYEWVMSGIRLLRDEGIPANPNDMLLYQELAWIHLHKLGGFLDDATQHYVREFAREWHQNLGEPPALRGDRARDAVIERYAQWLQPIVDAPDTPQALYERVPSVRELVDEYRLRIGDPFSREMLARYADMEALRESPDYAFRRASFGPKTSAMDELMSSEAYAEAWPALLAYVRRRVLQDEYHMSPAVMQRFTRKFGPIDWRLPSAHAVYWSALGVERGMARVRESNKDAFDFLNTDRVTMQGIQDLWRKGSVYYNHLDMIQSGGNTAAVYYQAMPNPYFVDTYGDMIEEIEARGGIFEDRQQRAWTSYSAGYTNFLADAIRFFYRRGDTLNAQRYYDELRNAPANLNDPAYFAKLSLPLDEFVAEELKTRLTSPQVAREEVAGALQNAFVSGLLAGDTELYQGMIRYAAQAHKYYMEEQARVMTAGGGMSRMEVMDRDFWWMTGNLFAAFLTNAVDVEEAEIMYANAPNSMKQYAYDALRDLYQAPMNQIAERGAGRPFAEVFPEPPGMAQHREMVRRKQQERAGSAIDSIQQK